MARPEPVKQTHWPADGAWRDLLVHLDEVRELSGRPSYEQIAREAHVNRSTVQRIFTGENKPTEKLLIGIVSAAGGEAREVDKARRLFTKAQREGFRAPSTALVDVGDLRVARPERLVVSARTPHWLVCTGRPGQAHHGRTLGRRVDGQVDEHRLHRACEDQPREVRRGADPPNLPAAICGGVLQGCGRRGDLVAAGRGEQVEFLGGPRGHPLGRQGRPTSEEEPSGGIQGEEQARDLDLKGGQRT